MKLSLLRDMEPADTVRPLPGDRSSFKFLASTNSGNLERVEILDKTHGFVDMIDQVKFALVDQTQELSLDAEGYFSRPVSMVMIFYPMVVPREFDMVGSVLGMTFRVTNSKGKSGNVSSCFKVSNCKSETVSKSFKSLSGYSSATHSVFDKTKLTKNQKVIDMIAWVHQSNKYWYLNPSSPKTLEIMAANGIEWNMDSVKTTRFVKMEKSFTRIYDHELNNMDLTSATDAIEVKNKEVIGYSTDFERRCAVNANVANVTSPSLVNRHFYLVKGEEEAKKDKK